MSSAPCPICGGEGILRSRHQFEVGAPRQESYRVRSFFGPDGEYHLHNPNPRYGLFRCEQRHYWSESFLNGCGSCDFATREITVTPITFPRSSQNG